MRRAAAVLLWMALQLIAGSEQVVRADSLAFDERVQWLEARARLHDGLIDRLRASGQSGACRAEVALDASACVSSLRAPVSRQGWHGWIEGYRVCHAGCISSAEENVLITMLAPPVGAALEGSLGSGKGESDRRHSTSRRLLEANVTKADVVEFATANGGAWLWSCSSHCTSDKCGLSGAAKNLSGPVPAGLGNLACAHKINAMCATLRPIGSILDTR